MPDYKNGKIYKLWSPEGDDIYIGSTTQPLYARLSGHKKKEKCSSKILFEKYNNVKIELIESYPCDNIEELNKKEGEYIRANNCVNRCVAGRTVKEYQEDNKEKIKEREKGYRENNKEKKKEYRKVKYTCECGRTFNFGDKARHMRSKVHQLANGGAEPSDGAALTSVMAR